MRFLIGLIALPFMVFATTATQVLSFAYFDQDRVQFRIPEMPNFLREQGEEKAERGYMVFYERKLFDVLSVCSFYAGGDIGKYEKGIDSIYSASLFLSGRLWIMHLAVVHPYVEVSVFGPTVLSKSEFALTELASNFLFQNYLSLGAEVGSGSGLSVELKAVRYLKPDPANPEQAGVQVPLLLSVGYLF